VKAIYVKISDDYCSSWSLPKPLVPISEDFSGDDNPSIAIRGNTIYVVFSRWLYDPGGDFPRMDLYIVKSNDLGTSWDAPVAITSAGWFTYDFYRNPDIIVTANGTLFIAYYRTSTSPTIKQVEVRWSNDGGNTFSTSIMVFTEAASVYSWARERPASLTFDEASETLFLMSENLTESYPSYNITAQTWVSMDWGATWMRRGSIASGHDWLYLRGITIDVLPNGTLQSLLLGITDSAQITTLRSYDGGLSWVASGLLVLDDTVEIDMFAPTDVSHQDIHSGRSPRGEIFYVYGRSPALNQNRDVYLRAFTEMEQHYHGFISTNTSLTTVWNGKSSWGPDCEEGGYEVEARVIDVASNIAIQAQVCSIDNSIPQIVLSIPPFKDLNPSVQQQVAVQNTSSVIDYVVDLYYRFNSTGAFTRAPTDFNGTHFRQTIPSSTTDEVYFYFNATDLAGNSRLVGDIVTPMLYFRPNPMVIFTSSEGVPARPLDGRITIDVRGLPAAVLKEVYLSYSLDNWATNSTVRLVLDNNTLSFRITIAGGQKYSRLDYQVFFVRLGSTDLEIAGTPGFASQEPIPPFPAFEIEYPWNVILAMMSAAFGILLGFMQIIGKRSSSKRIQARFMHMLESYSESESASISSKKQFAKSLAAARKQRASMAEAKGLSRGNLMYRAITIGTLACIAGSLYATYTLGDGGIALLGSALGLLLSSLAFMERVNIDASDSIYIDKRPMNFLAVVHVALIIVVLAIFILAAPLVDWFNYYVVKQSFTVGPISIPRLYLSLVTPVVTSVALILYTSYHDLKNVLKRLELARVSGESWKVIWQQKEETVSKLASNVSLKIFIFLVTVSFAVISTTQIGRYAEQGMLVLLPFVIGWLGVFLIGTIAATGKSTVKEALNSWIIEKTKPCPQCKATNLFESQHCTSCGATFAGTTTIIEKTIECKQCKERSPEGSKHCRGCGLKF
jgi:hypothetical protein